MTLSFAKCSHLLPFCLSTHVPCAINRMILQKMYTPLILCLPGGREHHINAIKSNSAEWKMRLLTWQFAWSLNMSFCPIESAFFSNQFNNNCSIYHPFERLRVQQRIGIHYVGVLMLSSYAAPNFNHLSIFDIYDCIQYSVYAKSMWDQERES